MVVGLLACAGLVGGCGGGDTADSGSRLLVVRETSEGNPDIYLMSSTGAILQQLTTDAGYDLAPRWSPDGSRIAFLRTDKTVESRRLYIMNADGTSERNLYPGEVADADLPNAPDWLDNDTLVFQRGSKRSSGLVKRSITTGEVTVLTTPGADSIDGSPSVSPDGSKIAFIRTKNVTSDMYVVNSDGTQEHRVLTDIGADPPAWSPDGTKLAFPRITNTGGPRTREIYIANADGSNPQQLTTNDSLSFSPIWSPDGGKIIFVGGGQLIQINADSTGIQILTDDGPSTEAYGWR